MTNYRAYGAVEATGSLSAPGNSWGVMRGTLVCSGSITLANDSIVKAEHLQQGQPFPCYVKQVAITAGSIYILV
jgi:hypothetical protein